MTGEYCFDNKNMNCLNQHADKIREVNHILSDEDLLTENYDYPIFVGEMTGFKF